MTKLGCLMTTVDHYVKRNWLNKMTDAIDCKYWNFAQKYVVVDHIYNEELGEELREGLLRDRGWTVIDVDYKDRPKTLLTMIEHFSECDYVLHAEDDIYLCISLNNEEIISLLNHEIDGRKCGILTPSLGGSTFKSEGGDHGDFVNLEKNIYYSNDKKNTIAFVRDENYASSYFFELGTLFIKTDIFAQCLKYVFTNCAGMQLEQALTKAWFDLGLYKHYYKATWCKSKIRELWETQSMRLDPECRFIDCWDKNQGASLYGGKHTI